MAAKFLTKLGLEKSEIADNGEWTVASPFRYYSEILKREIYVPAGFATDLASVPRLPLVYLLTGDSASEAAVIHDFLYFTHSVPRILADAIFREASAASRVPWWKRNLMWAGVRVFGGSHWD